jgi:hypothetical protein
MKKALVLLKADPDFPLDKLATMFQLSVTQLREATVAGRTSTNCG